MGDEITVCSVCGTRLSPGMTESDCPGCLLKRGLESNTLASEGMVGGRPGWVPPVAAELALRFPGLEISEFIGRGGMGAVYKARQTSLDRVVALKILPPEIGREADFTQRFAREAQAMAKLNHPHIVAIYDFGQADDLFYFLMEFVDGPSLRHILNTGGVSANEALAIVPQICEALQFAHDHGIVHRDIKPENILLNRQGQVKIADFGLAKLIGQMGETPAERPGEGAGANINVAQGDIGVDRSGDCTAPGKILGTPRYMAPEQKAQSDSVDHRADIYSLGVVFYEMLTGELPGKQIIPPSQKIAIDVRLDEIVLRALEKQPEQRYQHASEIKTQVATVVGMETQGVETPNQAQCAAAEPLKQISGVDHTATAPVQVRKRDRRWIVVSSVIATHATFLLIAALASSFAPYVLKWRIYRPGSLPQLCSAIRVEYYSGNWLISLAMLATLDGLVILYCWSFRSPRILQWWSRILAACVVLIATAFTAVLAAASRVPAAGGRPQAASSAYNKFVPPRMYFAPQRSLVKLRYIFRGLGRLGRVSTPWSFPVWNANGDLVRKPGIRRFIAGKAVGIVQANTSLFFVFSCPADRIAAKYLSYNGLEGKAYYAPVCGALTAGHAIGGLLWFYVSVVRRKSVRMPSHANISIQIAYTPWIAGKKLRGQGKENSLYGFQSWGTKLQSSGAGDVRHLKYGKVLIQGLGTVSSVNSFGTTMPLVDKYSFVDLVWARSRFARTQRLLAAYSASGAKFMPSQFFTSKLGPGMLAEHDVYQVPLSQIKYFRVLSRPIHTITFYNVALEPNPPQQTPGRTPLATGPGPVAAGDVQPAVMAATGDRR